MLKIYKTKYDYEAVELVKKEKGFAFSKFIEVELSPTVQDFADSVSLFNEVDTYLVKCDKESSLEFLTKELLESCQKSLHRFVFWGKSAEFKKAVEALGFEVFEKKEPFQEVFPKELVAAIQTLDKRKAWVCLRAELEKKSGEEVYGVCNWTLKQMMTVISMPTLDEKSGVKDFQYRQVKKNLTGKDIEKVRKIYFDFVNSYNTSRAQSIDLGTALEMWVLGW